MSQAKLDQIEYKFGFNFSRKTFPNCLAKSPLNDNNYLVIDYYRPRENDPGWYVAIRGYGEKRPKEYVLKLPHTQNQPITYKEAIKAFADAYQLIGKRFN